MRRDDDSQNFNRRPILVSLRHGTVALTQRTSRKPRAAPRDSRLLEPDVIERQDPRHRLTDSKWRLHIKVKDIDQFGALALVEHAHRLPARLLKIGQGDSERLPVCRRVEWVLDHEPPPGRIPAGGPLNCIQN